MVITNSNNLELAILFDRETILKDINQILLDMIVNLLAIQKTIESSINHLGQVRYSRNTMLSNLAL